MNSDAESVQVFFNPACSKCQTLQGILERRGVQADYVRYLDTAPSRHELERVLALLGSEDPRVMMRADEPIYAELHLQDADRDALLDAMTSHPVLIQRPIVIRGDRAVIARPAELVEGLLDD